MKAADGPLVLGIETSCDETGIGIVRGGVLLADVVASSVDEHARFGGVVPEVASRAHLEAMLPSIQRACGTAGIELADLDAIAVTSGPGLVGALLVGTATAKALAIALDVPVYGVNHLAGHVVVDEIEHGPLPEGCVALIVSGGHTSLVLVREHGLVLEPLGATLDDAAGEAFDKVARLLDLPFPGGPWIDRAAREGDPQAIDFPRGLTIGNDAARYPYDFSFSGVKSAVLRWIRDQKSGGNPISVPDVAASFQEAVVDVLTRKAIDACIDHGVEHLVIGGGVAANSRLRVVAAQRCARRGIEVRIPRPGLCTDNGAMIALLGAKLIGAQAAPSALGFLTTSTMPVDVLTARGSGR